MVQPYKCVVWSFLGLLSRFLPPLSLCTFIGGIRFWVFFQGPFPSHLLFSKEALDDDVQHINVFFKLGDV
jgi:hypothetical protein